jgi:branched-chain amino acid transport system permease protein
MNRYIVFPCLFIGAIVLPVLIGDLYWIDIFIFMSIFIILSTSLRLIFSTGQISFAHPGIAAIGGYCSGVMAIQFGLSFWITLPMACLAASLVSIIIGYPTLRLKGVYFFLITFMFTSLIGVLIGNFWIPISGGWRGLLNIPRPKPIMIPYLFTINFNTSELAYYYLTLFFAVITVLVCYRMEKSRFGLVFNAIENADGLAEMVGINLMKYKLLAFVVGGVFAGIAGTLFAHYQRIITPYDFDMHLGILLIIYIVVGGMNTVFGPIFGTIFLRLLAHPLRRFGVYEIMILGVILILFLRFIPGGVISFPERLGLFKPKKSTKT